MFWLVFEVIKVINNIDKNLSGKSDEIEVKLCKTWFFTLHSSFFISRKTSFRTVKGKVWLRQRSCFIASNMVFHTTKRYLWRGETIPFANFDFVNRTFTVLNSCNHLSVNILQKTSKKWRFFDRVTLSFAQMPFIWAQNSNIIWQIPIHPNAQSGCSAPRHLNAPQQ